MCKSIYYIFAHPLIQHSVIGHDNYHLSVPTKEEIQNDQHLKRHRGRRHSGRGKKVTRSDRKRRRLKSQFDPPFTTSSGIQGLIRKALLPLIREGSNAKLSDYLQHTFDLRTHTSKWSFKFTTRANPARHPVVGHFWTPRGCRYLEKEVVIFFNIRGKFCSAYPSGQVYQASNPNIPLGTYWEVWNQDYFHHLKQAMSRKAAMRSTKRSTPTTGYRVGTKISRERRRRETSSGGKGIGKRHRRKPGQQPQCTKNFGTVRITRPNKRRRNGSGSTGTIQPTYEKKACIPGISTPRASSDYWTSPPKPYTLGQQVSHPKNVESLVLHLLQPIKEAALKQVQALEVVEKDVFLPDQAAAETPQTRAQASVLETHRAAQALIARAKTALLISPEDLSERQVIFFIYYYFRKRKNHWYQLQPCKQISRAWEGIPTQFLRHYLPTNQCAYGRCHKFLSL